MNEHDVILKRLKESLNDHIEMLYIQAKSQFEYNSRLITEKKSKRELKKTMSVEMINNFLKQKDYVKNNLSGRTIMTKGFVCVYTDEDRVEIWHDIKGAKSTVLTDSYLTGLPIALNYMERIN
jgi:hypothetical protein